MKFCISDYVVTSKFLIHCKIKIETEIIELVMDFLYYYFRVNI